MHLLLFILSYVIVAFISIILCYFMLQHNQQCKTIDPVNVSISFLQNMIPKGIYKGKGYYTPTPLYPNGIVTENILTVRHHSNGVLFRNNITAFDQKTKLFLYKGFRDGVLTHKLNHDSHLFRNSKHYIVTNDNTQTLATSLIGHAIRSNNKNEIVFDLSGVWYISNDKYKHITQYIKKDPSTGALFVNFTSHNSTDPRLDMIIKEHYVKQ